MKRTYAWAAFAVLVAGVVVLAGAFDPAAAAAIVTPDNLNTIVAEGAAGIAALEKQMGELATQLKGAADDVKKKGETLQTEMKNLGDASSGAKKSADDAILKHNELAEKHADLVKKFGEQAGKVVEIEQALAARGTENEPTAQKSIGEAFVESDAFKGFKGRGSIRVGMSRKDILNVTASTGTVTSPANSLVGSLRVPGIVTPPERKLTIRDLLAPGETSQGMIEYVQETGYTNNARVVTEGQTKPTSDITFELKTAHVRTLAHLFKASRQILDDAPALRSYIDARARYGLRLEEEDEILNGDGTGVHIKGLVPYATPFNAAFVADNKTRIDTIRLAILQVFLAEFPASGIVLHPTDWARISLTKDAQYRYLIGNPQDGTSPRLWNLPVVETQSMDLTEFLVGAFSLGAQIYDRMEIEVLLSTEDGDNFKTNMVTLRAEERLALAVYRPEAFVTGDFDTAT